MTTTTAPMTAGPAVREPGSPGGPPVRKKQGELNKDDFLKLLIAQLKNQDPQEPSKPEEMGAQLAQYTSVEQLGNISKTLETQGLAQSALINEVAAGTAIGNIGRKITATSDLIELTGSGTETLQLTGNGGPVTLNVFDARTGSQIATRNMGSVASGTTEFVVGKALSDLTPGVYRVKVTPTDPKSAATWSTAVRGTVTGLETTSNGLQYAMGRLRIPLSAVTEISTR